jgi:hypothetical protein
MLSQTRSFANCVKGTEMLSIFTGTASHEGRFRRLAGTVGVVCLVALVLGAQAAADTVTSPNDSGSGSLRAVIADADGGDTIDFHPSLDGQTIDLTSGAIEIAKSLTIVGPGASELTIDAGHNSRILTFTAGNLSISELTLANGAAPDDGLIPRSGGAIQHASTGSLTISDAVFSGNRAGGPGGVADNSGRGRGGAINATLSSGPTFISGSTFTGNSAGGPGGVGKESGRGWGGAIHVGNNSSLTVSDSKFADNSAGGPGGPGVDSGHGAAGAMSVSGGSASTLTVMRSTFSDNTAGGDGGDGSGGGGGHGGAIDISLNSAAISDSTFDANSAGGDAGSSPSGGRGVGGAIYTAGTEPLAVANSTLVGNTAGGDDARGFGGAMALAGAATATLDSVTIDANSVGDHAESEGAAIGDSKPLIVHSAQVTARATIVSGNTGATSCNMPVVSSRYSLEGTSPSDTSCGFDRPSGDPELAPLEDNGGPTQTQALPLSSPAVDVVPKALCPTSVDQRGEPRPEPGDLFCDLGAFERQDPVAPTITSGATATFQVGTTGSFMVAATGGPRPSLSQTGALPVGVAFTDNGDGTASLAGTPAAGTAGAYPIAIKASNGVLPDATQSFTLTVLAPPPVVIATPADGNGAPQPAPQAPPKPPPPFELSADIERRTLRRLLRTGKLVVAVKVNDAAEVALSGRARLKFPGSGTPKTRLVAVFQGKTVRFSRGGEKKVTLILTRKGRRALRTLNRVRLVVAVRATDAARGTAPAKAALTLRRR